MAYLEKGHTLEGRTLEGRTALSVSKSFGKRVTASAKQNKKTIEAFLTEVLDEHESRKFWDAVDSVGGRYGESLQDDYTLEEAMIRDGES